jgi:hypothetical protein
LSGGLIPELLKVLIQSHFSVEAPVVPPFPVVVRRLARGLAVVLLRLAGSRTTIGSGSDTDDHYRRALLDTGLLRAVYGRSTFNSR